MMPIMNSFARRPDDSSILLQIVAYFNCALYCGKYCSDFHIAIQNLFDRYCDKPINWFIVTALPYCTSDFLLVFLKKGLTLKSVIFIL